MKESIALFIRELVALAPGLGAAYQDTIDYWGPDEPPVTVALSDLGHRVVDDFSSVDATVNESVFRAIESALGSGDGEVATAVATGILEAMIGRAIRVGIWERVQPMLGERSTSHAAVWTASH